MSAVRVTAAEYPSIDVIPVNDCAADALFNATAVVPTYSVELPKTADGIVPERFPAVREVRDAPLPANPVAVKIPVEGINESFVVEILAAVLPAAVVHSGYTAVAVATSSVLFTGTVIFALPLNPTPLIVLEV